MGLDAEEVRARVVLAHAVEPGDAVLGRMIGAEGAVATLARIRQRRTGLRHGDALAARVDGVDAEQAEQVAARCGARIVTPADPEWPGQLAGLADRAPVALWVRGAADLRLLALRSVAVVGARACSAYGQEVAFAWSAELSQRSWPVFSGAAFGIDAAAHRGALAAGGATVAVLAGGVDVPYPRAHTGLIERIVDDGLVVSETPPGQAVRRQRFLARNRLIAAFTRATVVVEAAERSGAAATARLAGALNRPVGAVPGPVTAATSTGCHRLIREGDALLVAEVADVLALLDLDAVGDRPTSMAASDRDGLARRERTVLDAVPARGSIDVQALVRASGLATVDVLAATGRLVSTGMLDEAPGGWRLPRA